MNKKIFETLHKQNNDVSVETASVFSFYTHAHSYYEMTLYEPFDGQISVNDKVFNTKIPTAVLITPSDYHKIEVFEKSNAQFIKIGFSNHILHSEKNFNSYVFQSPSENSIFLIKLLFNEILQNRQNAPYISSIINTLVYNIEQHGEYIETFSPTKSLSLSVNAVKLIKENFHTDITLSSVANTLSVSPQYLSSVFKQNVGIGFSEYLSDIRLRFAATLLSEKQNNITQISEICGYKNISHFIRSFKKKYGVSPSLYTKTLKKIPPNH